jgi:hypothetical protein
VTSTADPVGTVSITASPPMSSVPTSRHRWAWLSSPWTIGIRSTLSELPLATVSTVWWVNVRRAGRGAPRSR